MFKQDWFDKARHGQRLDQTASGKTLVHETEETQHRRIPRRQSHADNEREDADQYEEYKDAGNENGIGNLADKLVQDAPSFGEPCCKTLLSILVCC